jgi:hypothetical protein
MRGRIEEDMKGKLLFVVGLGVGYVLGTRAGRERYEQISRAADRVWNQPAVQQGVGAVKDFAAEKLGDVSDTVLDKAKQFIGTQTSKSRSQSSSAARATSASGSSGSSSSATRAKSASNGAKSASNGAKSNGAKSNGTKSNGSSSTGSRTSAASDS